MEKFIEAWCYVRGGKEIKDPMRCYININEIKKILPTEKEDGCAVWLYKDEIYWVPCPVKKLLKMINNYTN